MQDHLSGSASALLTFNGEVSPALETTKYPLGRVQKAHGLLSCILNYCKTEHSSYTQMICMFFQVNLYIKNKNVSKV